MKHTTLLKNETITSYIRILDDSMFYAKKNPKLLSQAAQDHTKHSNYEYKLAELQHILGF